ncbi:chemotaxis protein CheC [Bacillus fonticola]|uniref:chemotaxis protein CheC n=1 Tax=Bacillus fonticola TaxID=2728853 RepID=UPI001473B083|nr:chemotaxis protein CheC [Bacillus fonticola]
MDAFTPIHMSVLKEIGNIGAGHAATALGNMLGKRMYMHVPHVKLATFAEVMELSGGSDEIVASCIHTFTGALSGKLFFLLPVKEATDLLQEWMGESIATEMAQSAFREMSNILAGSYLNALATFADSSIIPSPPAMTIDLQGAIMSVGLVDLSMETNKVIAIETVLVPSDSEDALRGCILLLPDPKALPQLFSMLGVEG